MSGRCGATVRSPAGQLSLLRVLRVPRRQASGHVDRFTDFMVTDAVTGDPYRADHLLEVRPRTNALRAAGAMVQPGP